jgi:hypothetical protein
VSKKFTPFSAKNFPYEGNENIKAAGERTVYVPRSPDPDFKHKDGFTVGKDTRYFDENNLRVEIKAGTKIHFLPPAKLHDGNSFGMARGLFAEFSLSSYLDTDRSGYIRITDVEKPKGSIQSRVSTGANTQIYVSSEVQKRAADLGLTFKLLSMAKIGSQKPDLQVSLSNTSIQFEIKGTSGATKLVTFFDKSVSRRNVPDIVEHLAQVFIEHQSIDGKTLGTVLDEHSLPRTFTGIIDYYQQYVDASIGFAGDPGVQSSGKMPKIFTSTDPEICLPTHQVMLHHFQENGDNYFVIHNRKLNTLTFYWTGHNENILGHKLLPGFDLFQMQTYGGVSHGATRLGMKVKLNEDGSPAAP